MIGQLLALALTVVVPPPASPLALPVDQPARVNGIEAACTGIAETRQEARWLSYGERIEFSNARNEYLVGGIVRVSDAKGRVLVEASCDAPWLLMRLPKGQYRLEGWLPGAPASIRSARFSAPQQGQIRLILQFLDQ